MAILLITVDDADKLAKMLMTILCISWLYAMFHYDPFDIRPEMKKIIYETMDLYWNTRGDMSAIKRRPQSTRKGIR